MPELLQEKTSDEDLRNIENMLSEIEVYQNYKKKLSRDIEKIEKAYQSEKFGYLEFSRRLDRLLKGKTEEEWYDYYDSYIRLLASRIDKLLGDIFSSVYTDRRQVQAPAPAPAPKAEQKVVRAEEKPSVYTEVDEHLEHLRSILHSPAAQQPFVRGPEIISLNVPKFEDVRREIALLEEKRAKKAHEAEVSEQIAIEEAAVAAEKARAKKLAEMQKEVQKQKAVHRHHFSLGSWLSRLISVFVKKISSLTSHIHITKEDLKPHFGIAPLFKKLRASGKVEKAQKIKRSSIFSRVSLSPLKRIFARKKLAAAEKKPVSVKKPEPEKSIAGKPSFFSSIRDLFGYGKRRRSIREVFEMEQQPASSEEKALKKDEQIGFGWFSARRLFDEIFGSFRKKQEGVIATETEIPSHIKKLRELRRRVYDEQRASAFDTTLLAQEAKRVKRILEVEKPSVAPGSSLGLIANVTVKRLSLRLVETFPGIFSQLYNALRAANIKVLSNTYVNIMILISG
ncbi:hypothetical protein JXB11_01510, partial [Candidatus Woesearchaeota archaeon]|nr:hypothetical protein [Candidatus Woesearchaeota archaeon]